MAADEAVVDAPELKAAKSAAKQRKRAPKACLSCRARKVRCDVSQRGRPCMNCYLDSETCVVTGRASRFRRRETNDNAQASYPPYSNDDCDHAHTAEDVVKSRANGHPVPNSVAPPTPAQTLLEPADRTEEVISAPTSVPAAKPDGMSKVNSSTLPGNASPANQRADARNNAPTQPSGGSLPSWASQQLPINFNTDIVYSYYPFLSISNLPNILPQDVNYLELQGCLRVPTKAILDEFVQQYFLHVHPLLPLFNEGDFWDIYCGQAPAGQKISLLVFQALIFSTCNFVSRNSIKALGFSSIRSARAALYRRAKLLYDFESESSPLSIAQAALLLSLWSPVSNSGVKKPNSAWLSLAIQHAKAAEAHHYSTFISSAASADLPTATRTQLKRQNILKRLWWCCIIRDRVLPLGVRRSIQITRAHFDFDSNAQLGVEDLADEVDRSKVYNASTKKCLIQVLAQFVELCVLLTDILVLVYPLDDAPGWGRQVGPGEVEKIRDGKIALRRWSKGAAFKLPMVGGDGTAQRERSQGREYYHDSVILYTNLLYMYFHSSRVALCHHEVLHLAMASPTTGNVGVASRDLSTIYENRHELQDAASGVTECLRELIQLRLARWLPVSAVACTALPLVLHILDAKLSSPRGPRGGNKASPAALDPSSEAALKQHRLNILIEAMKTYQPQYDGVDRVSETIRHIVNLAQLDGHAENGDSDNGIHDWTDILTSHPSLYLRLALTMDLSLSKDRLPEEGDFPASLRGLLTGSSGPVRSIPKITKGGANGRSGHGRPAGLSRAANQSFPSAIVSPQETMRRFVADDQALSCGIELGVDMELDVGPHAQVGTEVPLSDDEESLSPPSGVYGDEDDTSPSSASYVDQLNGVAHADGEPNFQPFTVEDMEGLESHVLDAFMLQNESPVSSGSHELFGLGEQDGARQWFEQALNEVGGEPTTAASFVDASLREEDDQHTARALLDAMRSGDTAA